MKTNFPTLYSIDAIGEKREWSISVFENVITIHYGYYEAPTQLTPRIVTQGHQGRNSWEQAIFEARSLYYKKLDSGYTPNKSGIADPPVPLPMLAKQFKDRKHLIEYPVLIQPKLDGFRCITTKKNGEISCWSRKGKKYETTHAIEQELSPIMEEGEIFDGELYNHEISFESVSSAIKNPASKVSIYLYIYDLINENAQVMRLHSLREKFKYVLGTCLHVKEVPFKIANSEEEVNRISAEYIQAGYEGAMVRLPYAKYRAKHRSSEMLKVKNFLDDEFTIIGFKDGIGKEEGAVIWELQAKEYTSSLDPTRESFFCRPKGSYEMRRKMFENGVDYIGKRLTVRYFELTELGLPRFPVGIRIREDL